MKSQQPADASTGNESPGNDSSLVVSIINYRTADLTLQCVASVLADLADAGPQVKARVVVVDNASGDGSADIIADWIAAQDPAVPVTLVRSAGNTGFSGGHNQGIAAQKAAFYLLLNSDALLRPGFVRAILAAAHRSPEIGLFAPRIEYEDGTQQESCFRLHGPASELIRGANSGPISRLLRRYDVALEMPPADGDIGWASFACILLRASMIDDIGMMDEGYFLYYEDSEYRMRARRAGWRIAYVNEARAIHFRGGSAPVKALAKARKRLPAYYYASRTRFLYQAHGWRGFILANLLWHLGRGIALPRRITNPNRRPGIENEARDIWINATAPLGDRRAAKG